MYTRQGAQAYASVGVETGVMSASPHQLIVLLFDGAQAALRKARWAQSQNDIAARGQALSKAIRIIDEGLKGGLDPEKGGELAERLSSLYDYMVRQLIRANIHGDTDRMDEVAHLLTDIGDAWKSIGEGAPPSASPIRA
ncbi:flagellar protein FliS [Kushneria sinocarnis]|uniref:Flagellar secretion chaperone FliS n=1 Tax=Kushneria sinocarnis TaxID=595502 RepID=A0A420WXZ8_9GAMM|nr:flagellar export chaperone FliS [Kushneria sinocarnis]RKR06058.1 flagellar protein FliS [Kushneria sinocarnis]